MFGRLTRVAFTRVPCHRRLVSVRRFATVSNDLSQVGGHVGFNPQFDPKGNRGDDKTKVDNKVLDLKMHELLPKQKWKEITELFEQNLDRFSQLQAETVINAYFMLKNNDQVLFVHEKMKERQMKHSPYSAASVILCLAEKDVTAAYDLVVDLIEKQKVVPMIYSCMHVFSKLVALEDGESQEKADKLFKLIPREVLDLDSYKIAVKELVKRGNVTEAMQTLMDMNVGVDTELFDIVFEGCENDIQSLLKLAEQLMEAHPKFQDSLEKETIYDLFSLMFFRTERFQYGMEVFELMLRQKMTPCFFNYHYAVYELCRQKRLDSALSLSYTMPWPKDSEFFANLVYSLIMERRINDIPDLLIEMLDHYSDEEEEKYDDLHNKIKDFFKQERSENRQAVAAANKKIFKHTMFRVLCDLFEPKAADEDE
jgi:hypothetical protein